MAVVNTVETGTLGPVRLKRPFQWNSINGQRSVSPEPRPKKARTEHLHFQREERTLRSPTIAKKQSVLLLHGKGQKYTLEHGYDVPELKGDNELLIKIQYIGLNPIDWKAPDFGFGIPELPYIAGRDLVGTVVQASRSGSRIKKGDVVFSASTDYRDLRKAAFQQFAIAADFNVCRVPENAPREQFAGLGVAFVAAALVLGVSLGCDFSGIGQSTKGPNLLRLLSSLDPEAIPADQRGECLGAIEETETPRAGDWILVWGGSSTSAKLIAQLSKLIGLRVIKVVDVGKHGERLSQGHADLLVDQHDPERAIDIIRKVTHGNLRFAVDTVGRKTAELCQRAMRQSEDGPLSHLVGLSGLPKETVPGIKHHKVPIKVYHEVPEVGDSLMKWLEALLSEGQLTPPDIEVSSGGLEGINDALDRMRKGEVSGRRVVVKI